MCIRDGTSGVHAASDVAAASHVAAASRVAAKRRIILIGVDHARASSATAATSARPWQLPDGLVVNVDGPTGAAPVASRGGPYVTVSIGLAELDLELTPDFDALCEAADQALYRAKECGRNRIEFTAP